MRVLGTDKVPGDRWGWWTAEKNQRSAEAPGVGDRVVYSVPFNGKSQGSEGQRGPRKEDHRDGHPSFQPCGHDYYPFG